MPTYDYKCRDCGHLSTQTVEIRFRDALVCQQPGCMSRDYERLYRLPSAPAIAFKGSGFYATDYKGKP
jgi:putative FmdB family regulatory protein